MEEDIEIVKEIVKGIIEGFTIIYERQIEALENIIQRMEDLYES